MLELLNSLVRLSAAVTVYGMQEVQSAAGSVSSPESMEKFREIIDSMTNAITGKIDASKRPTLDSFSTLGQNVVDQTVGRTLDTLNHTLKVPSMSPGDLMQSTSDAAKSTSDWLGGIVKPVPTVVIVEETVVVG